MTARLTAASDQMTLQVSVVTSPLFLVTSTGSVVPLAMLARMRTPQPERSLVKVPRAAVVVGVAIVILRGVMICKGEYTTRGVVGTPNARKFQKVLGRLLGEVVVLLVLGIHRGEHGRRYGAFGAVGPRACIGR